MNSWSATSSDTSSTAFTAPAPSPNVLVTPTSRTSATPETVGHHRAGARQAGCRTPTSRFAALGTHRLKDLLEPEVIEQVTGAGPRSRCSRR